MKTFIGSFVVIAILTALIISLILSSVALAQEIKVTTIHPITEEQWAFEGKPSHFIIGREYSPVVTSVPEVRFHSSYVELERNADANL